MYYQNATHLLMLRVEQTCITIIKFWLSGANIKIRSIVNEHNIQPNISFVKWTSHSIDCSRFEMIFLTQWPYMKRERHPLTNFSNSTISVVCLNCGSIYWILEPKWVFVFEWFDFRISEDKMEYSLVPKWLRLVNKS